MKKIFLLPLMMIMMISLTQAQKFAFVDTDYILENIPDYQAAQKELDQLSVKWQNQIEAKYAEIDKLYKTYQAEQVLMTEDMKRKKEDEIIKKEKEAKDYQKSKFGVEGELYKRRQELVKPIQDDIYNAIKEVATTGRYAIIFDKSTQSNVLYANSTYDKSDDILKKLGYEVGSD
ncbi:MAG: OmpH family outer membrane protein [Flavobacteriales bacterium]|nr:OmpH family outer membrane protein [Flavobacteriales bacterium]